jgi:hypothetical protein
MPLEAWMFVCVYSVFVLPFVGSGFAADWSPVQGALPTVLRLRNWSETKRFTDALCSRGSNRNKGIYIYIDLLKYSVGNYRSRNISFDIPTGYELDSRGSILTRPRNFFLFHRVQTGPEAHPASYPMSMGSSFPEGKAAEMWSWPFTDIQCRDQDWSDTSTFPHVSML